MGALLLESSDGDRDGARLVRDVKGHSRHGHWGLGKGPLHRVVPNGCGRYALQQCTALRPQVPCCADPAGWADAALDQVDHVITCMYRGVGAD